MKCFVCFVSFSKTLFRVSFLISEMLFPILFFHSSNFLSVFFFIPIVFILFVHSDDIVSFFAHSDDCRKGEQDRTEEEA